MKIGGVNKLPTNYDLGGGNLTLFDAQFGNWMRQNASIIMECSIDEVDALRKIFELDIPRQTGICDIQREKFIQARTHKKRRINKKWAKRYGYKRITIIIQGLHVKMDTDGNVEFVK